MAWSLHQLDQSHTQQEKDVKMNSKFEGPFISAFETDVTGVVKQELITYRIKDGMLRKEVATRTFHQDGKDWLDSSTVTPLAEVK